MSEINMFKNARQSLSFNGIDAHLLLFLNRTLAIKINRPARFRLPLHFTLNQRKRIIDERLCHIGAAGIHPFRGKEFFPVADLINIDRAAFQMVWTVFTPHKGNHASSKP